MGKGDEVVPGVLREREAGYPQVVVVGVDEVGRGCLAGPVVAGAVVLAEDLSPPWLEEVRDSKLLASEKRAELAPLISAWSRAWAIGWASVEEIDRINIFHASHLAMVRAIEGLGLPPGHVLVDGKFSPRGLGCPVTAIVKGDQSCLSIACASILAKVWRDRKMEELDAEYPGYGFAEHKGYSTPAHGMALESLGPCAIHRRSFAPVAEKLTPRLL